MKLAICGATLVLSGLISIAQAAPMGGQISVGSGNISQSGLKTTITQQSQQPFRHLHLGRKKLDDVVDATATVTGKQVHLANIDLTGNHRDTLGGGGISAVDLSLVAGRLDIHSPGALFIDSLFARTNGAYMRLAYNGTRLQRLTDDDVFSASLSGQVADKNLDSSAKFSLGGANGVRAYPQGEVIGDEGTLVSL